MRYRLMAGTGDHLLVMLHTSSAGFELLSASSSAAAASGSWLRGAVLFLGFQ